jgi:hypothetical protein
MVRTIKLLQMLLILSSIGLSTVSHGVASADELCQNHQITGPGDDTHPWPWDFAVKFPWDDVQGVWRAEKDGKTLYFMFKRVQAKRIKIKQIDISSCEVIGTGQGFERAKTVIVAQMMEKGGESYNFTLYAFNTEDSPEPPILSRVGTDQVIVVRINSLTSSEPEFTAQMVRLSDRLEMACGPEEKRLKF